MTSTPEGFISQYLREHAPQKPNLLETIQAAEAVASEVRLIGQELIGRRATRANGWAIHNFGFDLSDDIYFANLGLNGKDQHSSTVLRFPQLYGKDAPEHTQRVIAAFVEEDTPAIHVPKEELVAGIHNISLRQTRIPGMFLVTTSRQEGNTVIERHSLLTVNTI